MNSHSTNDAAGPDEPRDDALLVEFLRERDADCPACRYNLRNLTSNRCPECGHRLALHVTAPDVRYGPLIGLIASLLAMTGVAFLFVIMCIVYGPPYRGFVAVVIGIVYGLAAVPAAIFLYRCRLRFLRLSPVTQLVAAAASWMWHLALIVIFVLTIR